MRLKVYVSSDVIQLAFHRRSWGQLGALPLFLGTFLFILFFCSSFLGFSKSGGHVFLDPFKIAPGFVDHTVGPRLRSAFQTQNQGKEDC